MNKALLIEIGVEELPAVPFLEEFKNLEVKWAKILEENSILCEFNIFFTPRRIVIYHREFPSKQPDTFKEFFGPPINVAFKDKTPTKAAVSFAKKCNVDIEKLQRVKRGNKEYLYCKKNIEGKSSKELIEKLINNWLDSLEFKRKMRWNKKHYFIRPVRWALVLFGAEFIECNIYGIISRDFTFIHRNISLEPVKICGIKNYFEILEKNGVILFQDSRKEMILKEISKAEKKENFKVDIDLHLLEEIVAICEYPKVIVGEFEKDFLKLPQEVIIASMKEHQKYFAVRKTNKLINKFVCVANTPLKEISLIKKGNERVLRARLKDALFFWEKDIENGLNFDGLKEIIFVEGGGSIFDKELRELKIARILFELYNKELINEQSIETGELKALLERSVMLSKADLLTQMVYEFTQLQGIMGYYYAKARNEHPLVALAIREQYLPIEDSFPTTLFTSLIAVAAKLDTIFTLFSLKKIPTGSKDPFALRRAAAGIIKIVLKNNINFNIEEIFKLLQKYYPKADLREIEEFFIDRLNGIFDVNPSLIKSVVSVGERDILLIKGKIEALSSIVESKDFKHIFITFKRVANILKEYKSFGKVDEKLFKTSFETVLYKRIKQLQAKKFNDYEEKLIALFGLKKEIDKFFDNVLVNVEDEKLKNNRKNLLGMIYDSFREIADIKEISV
jgi:glycyl-tRNA synthetase beta chain